MIFKKLFGYSDETKTAHGLYTSLVEQSRLPIFYVDYGVPDTLEGRFDMIVLHAALIIMRLKRDADRTRRLSQALFDYMFGDFDQNLRQMGFGDMGVGTRVKKMATAFYGRLKAYEEGLAEDSDSSLMAAIDRNLFHAGAPSPEQLVAMVGYMRREWTHLEGQGLQGLIEGRVTFDPPDAVDGNEKP